MKTKSFQEILARLKAEKEVAEAAAKLEALLLAHQVEEVDLSQLGWEEPEETAEMAAIHSLLPIEEERYEELTGILREVISGTVNPASDAESDKSQPIDKTGVARAVILNSKQEDFNRQVQTGADVILIGAAGTGKTTCMRRVTRDLIDSGRIPLLTEDTKWLKAGLPGAVILSYTRKAVNNIRHAVVEELKSHTLTAHKLLEFQPEFYDILDPATGTYKKTMSFIPGRTALNPLPRSLKFIAWEEGSMVPVTLYELVEDAMSHSYQEIFLGDIQQLPPVFGAGILGFKMLELPIVELTEVYRQALESPIIQLAWKVLEGNPHTFSPLAEVYETENGKGEKVKRKRVPSLEELSKVAFREDGSYIGTVKFQIWQKPLEDFQAVMTCTAQFKAWEKEGYYLPDTDVILCPYDKAFGAAEINRGISQYLGEKRGAQIYEVIAGFNKHYLAVGDRVLYDKEDAFIVSISRNVNYFGTPPAPASANLDRWGTYKAGLSEQEELEARASKSLDEDALDDFLEIAASAIGDRVQEASHDVVIRYAYSDEEQCLSKAAEINNLLGGNAMTIYKFQGSEADRVFIVLHHSHAKMISRELLYTAITRAKIFLHIICEPKSFFNGVASQRIKGNTLAEKALQFTGLKEKREIEKVKAELDERKKEHDDLVAYHKSEEKYEEEIAVRQQEKLKAELPVQSTEALEKVLEAKPEMGAWYFDVKAGKMMQRVEEEKAKASILPDITSDPAEELPEAREYEYSKTKPETKTTSELAAERLARIRAKRGG